MVRGGGSPAGRETQQQLRCRQEEPSSSHPHLATGRKSLAPPKEGAQESQAWGRQEKEGGFLSNRSGFFGVWLEAGSGAQGKPTLYPLPRHQGQEATQGGGYCSGGSGGGVFMQ